MLPEVIPPPSKVAPVASSANAQRSSCDMNPLHYVDLSANNFRENLRAMECVKFKSPPEYQGQYLDLGCGPGDFLAEHLLPRLRPCKRVVAVDISTEMLDYARKQHQHPEVFYEQLDIEHGDPRTITEKHGVFDGVYAFMALHFVKDLEKTYYNISRLLKEGGECLALNAYRSTITDALQEVYGMKTWTDLAPPWSSDRFARVGLRRLSLYVAATKRSTHFWQRVPIAACLYGSGKWQCGPGGHRSEKTAGVSAPVGHTVGYGRWGCSLHWSRRHTDLANPSPDTAGRPVHHRDLRTIWGAVARQRLCGHRSLRGFLRSYMRTLGVFL
ncbi:uncharacterized protein LOC144099450 isoform X2 [Amblyomma americanum]